jgi:glycosyltransferase involved in cell wall biosynthesis
LKKVAIIGSHGLYAKYGGWDQLVNNLAELKSDDIEYLIFNSAESSKTLKSPAGVIVKRLGLKASGFQGLFYDFWSILIGFRKVDTILLLGVQGMPVLPILLIFKKVKIISNVGGIEWERPKFGFFSKLYLKLCFKLSFVFSDYIIFDNPYYNKFIPKRSNAKVRIIPYGGEIDTSLDVNEDFVTKYSFINRDYILSISRSLRDNMIDELCESFLESKHTLVLISNFSNSQYGNTVYNKYKDHTNIVLINGLYIKPELDLIRRKCKAYIHTHTLCGTAPSLVEMIIAQRPVISNDLPQNKFTLHNQAYFFSSFSQIQILLNSNRDLSEYIPSREICDLYDWRRVVKEYESVY